MLPKENRLKKELDIKLLFKKGRGVFDKYVGARTRKNNLEMSRFVVMVGTKIHKRAYKRNRLKRQIKAILQKHLAQIADGYDVAIIATKSSVNASSSELEQSTLHALRKAGLLKDTPKL